MGLILFPPASNLCARAGREQRLDVRRGVQIGMLQEKILEKPDSAFDSISPALPPGGWAENHEARHHESHDGDRNPGLPADFAVLKADGEDEHAAI